MEPKLRSSLCLFCFGDCSQLQASSLLKEEIPGAVHCTTLKRQLQNLFILRNILDIDASWCEETLRRRAEAEEKFKRTFTDFEEDSSNLKDVGNLELWFKLCNKCILKVEELWKLHQKLLGIQNKMNAIKGEIKETMKDGMKKNLNWASGGIEGDIRNLVIPNLNSESHPEFLDDDDGAFHHAFTDNNVDDFIPQQMKTDGKQEVGIGSITETETEFIPQKQSPTALTLKRKRGRPPKSVQKRQCDDANHQTFSDNNGGIRNSQQFNFEGKLEVKTELTESATQVSDEFKLKRKRGRPPKSLQKKPSDESVHQKFADNNDEYFATQQMELEEQQEVKMELAELTPQANSEFKLKRRRGRPRKTLPTFPSNSNNDNFISVKMESDELQKVKVESLECNPQLSNELSVKRKRGRPPKRLQMQLKTTFLNSRRHRRRRRKRPGPRPLLKQIKKTRWFCQQCDACFRVDNQDRIRAHLERHKKSDETGGGEFDCPQCTFPAQDCLELEVHIRIKHINSMKKGPYRYYCPKEDCNFRGTSRKGMVEHGKEHHPELNLTEEDFGGESNLPCSQCTRVFSNSRSLAKHQRWTHPHLVGAQQEEVQCGECDLKFTSKIYLQAHINSTHRVDVDDHRFICDDCGRGFPFLSRLNAHKIVHVTKREYLCQICKVDYANKETYLKHLRIFHDDANIADQEVLKCRFCPFETPFRPALQKHIQSHKEEMGFKCDKCSRCYTNAQGLKRHQRINHGGTIVPCTYCNKKFPSEEYMKDHVRRFCKMRELKEQQQQESC